VAGEKVESLHTNFLGEIKMIQIFFCINTLYNELAWYVYITLESHWLVHKPSNGLPREKALKIITYGTIECKQSVNKTCPWLLKSKIWDFAILSPITKGSKTRSFKRCCTWLNECFWPDNVSRGLPPRGTEKTESYWQKTPCFGAA